MNVHMPHITWPKVMYRRTLAAAYKPLAVRRHLTKVANQGIDAVHKLILALVLVALPLTASAEDCKFSAPRNADLDAAGLRSLQLTLGSTDLDIQSAPGLNKIEVRGTACASDEAKLKNLQVNARRNGDHATVDTGQSGGYMNISLFGSSYAYIKLQVRVPASLAINVDSGSGDVNATDLASLDFDSGSGDLIADHIAGALTLKLGSADVKARQVGSVELHGTGSGDVHVTGVQGNVHADHSGSGDLNFDNVTGSVNIGGTGSGDISLSHVGRDVEVGSTGSGDVSADGVGGNFTVHSTGSGDIRHSDIKGKVSVPKSDDE
jgi:DUF4097 and DUF4098 domain-containing protein YvlB